MLEKAPPVVKPSGSTSVERRAIRDAAFFEWLERQGPALAAGDMVARVEAVRRSVRNLEKVKLIAADQLNVFDLLHANSLVVSEEALAKIQEVYGDG